MAHQDLDKLLSMLLPFGQNMLKKYGEFYPFASSMDTTDEIALVADAAENENPSPHEIIKLIIDGFCNDVKNGNIRAAAFCQNVSVTMPLTSIKTDAIHVHLEHENGEAVELYQPYKKGWFGIYKFEDIFATKGEHLIFKLSESVEE